MRREGGDTPRKNEEEKRETLIKKVLKHDAGRMVIFLRFTALPCIPKLDTFLLHTTFAFTFCFWAAHFPTRERETLGGRFVHACNNIQTLQENSPLNIVDTKTNTLKGSTCTKILSKTHRNSAYLRKKLSFFFSHEKERLTLSLICSDCYPRPKINSNPPPQNVYM